MSRFILEPLQNLKLDKNRSRVKDCPCNRNNKDGKFVPFEGYIDRGYCHSCNDTFPVGNHTCPACKKEKAFSLYVDTEEGNTYLNKLVGKCLYCSYHYSPKQYFNNNWHNQPNSANRIPIQSATENYNKEPVAYSSKELQPESISEIPLQLFQRSLRDYNENCFVQYLIDQVGLALAYEACAHYFIGTSPYQFKREGFPDYTSKRGATIFWQVDAKGKIRAGKIMLYCPQKGKRVKEPFDHISWVHSTLKLKDYQLKQVIFGEHLIGAEPEKIICLVESEKTAVIASIYFPEYIWLACGSLTGLTAEKCKVLKGRDVVLYPDLKALDKWKSKIKELSHIGHFVVSALLEQNATEEEKDNGLDLADYLLRYPVSAFRSQPLHLYSKDMKLYNSYTRTGKDFDKMIIAGFTSKEGKFYDVLFDKEEILIKPGEREEAVKHLADFFEKRFVPAFFDGHPCLVHQPVQ